MQIKYHVISQVSFKIPSESNFYFAKMRLLTFISGAIGFVFLIYGFVTEGGSIPTLIGLIGAILLFIAFLLWLFKVKKF